MKISNFRDYSKYHPPIGTSLKERLSSHIYNTEFAVVDVETTRFFFFKRKETKSIYRLYRTYWRFSDTGDFTPSGIIEQLHKEYIHGK